VIVGTENEEHDEIVEEVVKKLAKNNNWKNTSRRLEK